MRLKKPTGRTSTTRPGMFLPPQSVHRPPSVIPVRSAASVRSAEPQLSYVRLLPTVIHRDRRQPATAISLGYIIKRIISYIKCYL